MKRIHWLRIGTLILVGSVAPLLVGCANTGEDRYTQGSKESPRLVEKKFRFNGTVLYHRDSRDYTILSDSGDEYYPTNLQSVYRKAGLRVQIHGESRGYAHGGSMRAIEIYDIKALSAY
ncbi:MAG: hypothetical protein B9S32_10280 [Verrucomicrobia bacterium Tous-C9LFEB]|nr:MAG: hypothetical protein B9S32_10280 [Verrucomicrobia bacterium Tous-C9LFEB]